MSNVKYAVSNIQEAKVIGIKPVQLFQPENEDAADPIQIEKKKAAKLQEQMLHEARDQASKIISEAEAEISQQRQQWESERSQLAEQAKLEGYQKGFETGRQEGFASVAEQLNEARETVLLAKQDYQTKVEESEDELLQLSLQIAEKILHQKLAEDKSTFLPLVKSALEDWKERSDVSVMVHPDVYEEVLAQKEELDAIIGPAYELMILPQQDIEAFSCILETPQGRIDASVDSQLQVIREKLFELRQEGE